MLIEKETREQIARYLKHYYADTIKSMYNIISGMTLHNPDVSLAMLSSDTDSRGSVRIIPEGIDPVHYDSVDLTKIISGYTGRTPGFSAANMFSDDDMSVLWELASLEGKKRIKKDKRIDLVAAVLGSDALFESFCLMLGGPLIDFAAAFEQDVYADTGHGEDAVTSLDNEEVISDLDKEDVISDLMKLFGCQGRWESLSRDPVFIKRKEYGMKLRSYVTAAVNLYGCIHIEELYDLITGYEPGWAVPLHNKEYTRQTRAYRHTLAFSPEWLCIYVLEEFADDCVPMAMISFDGYAVNKCFQEDMIAERNLFMKHTREIGHVPDEQELSGFKDYIRDESSFRVIYDLAAGKDMYLPSSKTRFLGYAYNTDHPDAEDKLREFLKKNYIDTFAKYAAECMASDETFEYGGGGGESSDYERNADASMDTDADGDLSAGNYDDSGTENDFTAEDAMELFMEKISRITGNSAECAYTDALDIIHRLTDLIDEFDFVFNDKKDISNITGYVLEISNNTRLWINHGHTACELESGQRKKTKFTGNGRLPVIMAESSLAAGMLEEERDKIERMGFTLDLDSNADEVPVFSLPGGNKGPVVQKKKIYPNDPCPCGSGRKYKKCCGRNRS